MIKVNEKLKSFIFLRFDLDQLLLRFFQGISKKVEEIKKVVQEERAKQKALKIEAIEKERKDLQEKLKTQLNEELKAKELELKE